jgi:phosphatidylglycerophosphatase A
MNKPYLPYPLKHPFTLIATWFCCGLSPKAPGTVASFFALPFAWLILLLTGPKGLGFLIILFFVLGTWISHKFIQDDENQDPSHIVIDEVVGQWITVLLTPPDLSHLIIGFLIFRLFDIMKPSLIGWLDQKIKGGLGIMLDDVAAGLCSLIILLGLDSLWHHLFIKS